MSNARLDHLSACRGRPGRNLELLPVRNYVIFYQPTADGIEIFRVLNGSRDIQGEFDSLIDSTE